MKTGVPVPRTPMGPPAPYRSRATRRSPGKVGSPPPAGHRVPQRAAEHDRAGRACARRGTELERARGERPRTGTERGARGARQGIGAAARAIVGWDIVSHRRRTIGADVKLWAWRKYSLDSARGCVYVGCSGDRLHALTGRGFEMANMVKGTRVAIHPACSEWMQGDRYGIVQGWCDRSSGTPSVRVKLDSGRVRTFNAANVSANNPPFPDVTVENHGSVMLVCPMNDAAGAWLRENTDGTWFAGRLAVEPRYVDSLLDGMLSEGFAVDGRAS